MGRLVRNEFNSILDKTVLSKRALDIPIVAYDSMKFTVLTVRNRLSQLVVTSNSVKECPNWFFFSFRAGPPSHNMSTRGYISIKLPK